MKAALLALLLGFGFGLNQASAQPTHNIIQMPRMMAMGGAGVALADDEYALFVNPAGLAGSDRSELKLLGLGFEGSWDIYSSFGAAQSAMNNFGVSSLNALMGKDIYMRAGATPILSLRNFSIAYVVDGQFSIDQYNQVNPTFELGSMITQGVQAGYGFSVNKGKRASTDDLRFGASTKILWRKGGYYDLSSADLLVASQSDGAAYLNSLMGPYAIGVGFDAGSQYVKKLNQRTEISAGTNLTDIGDTKFKSTKAMKIPMDWAVGLGYKTDINPFSFGVALDYRNILTALSTTNRLHLGFDVKMPLFRFYAGLSQLYITYGMAFDLWIMKISLVSYGEEKGVIFHQNGSRRYLLQFDFKLPI